MLPDDPDLVIFSDASLSGWGVCCDQGTTRGPWTLLDKYRHINELELLGAYYVLSVFSEHSLNVAIHL